MSTFKTEFKAPDGGYPVGIPEEPADKAKFDALTDLQKHQFQMGWITADIGPQTKVYPGGVPHAPETATKRISV